MPFSSSPYRNEQMYPLASFTEIPVGSIQTESPWNLQPFIIPAPSKDLCASITTLGLIRPPIVIISGKKDYILLTGRHRLMAFRDSFPDKSAIPVLLLQENNSQETILHFLLTDKIHSEYFSPMEKAYFFQYCLECMSVKTAAQKFLPLMNEKVQPHIITRLISLCNLEPEVQQSIHSGQINPKLGLELLSFSQTDRKTLHTLFKQLEFGGGKQKRLLTLCRDLSGRQQTTITTLLAGKEYNDILNHPEMNIPQQGASLLTLLHKQLYPQSNRAEEDFNRRVKRMELAPTCSVKHSQAFERDEVRLQVTFATLSHLEKQLATIKEIQKAVD